METPQSAGPQDIVFPDGLTVWNVFLAFLAVLRHHHRFPHDGTCNAMPGWGPTLNPVDSDQDPDCKLHPMHNEAGTLRCHRHDLHLVALSDSERSMARTHA